uniref:Uncharacterized protein n=1 Tax=Oryza meridionalis TaxID=40149 RepID=A0A0E0DLG9_9ORYZ
MQRHGGARAGTLVRGTRAAAAVISLVVVIQFQGRIWSGVAADALSRPGRAAIGGDQAATANVGEHAEANGDLPNGAVIRAPRVEVEALHQVLLCMPAAEQLLQASSPRTPSAATTSATASRHPMSLFLYRLDHWAYPDRVRVHLRGVDIAARESHPPTRPSASPTPTPTSAVRRTPVPALLPPPRAHLWPPRSPAGLPPCFPTTTAAAGRSRRATLLLSRLAPEASTPAAGRLAQKRKEKRRLREREGGRETCGTHVGPTLPQPPHRTKPELKSPKNLF